MDHVNAIWKSVRQFSSGTALSRCSGMLRDIAMASCFGSSPEIAAFMVAYRLANLFRRLFGEGNLQSGFIPHFESLRIRHGELAAFLFYRDAAFSMSAFLLIFLVVVEAIFCASCTLCNQSSREIIRLTMWMTPGLLFICLSSMHTALLQCQRRYFAPSVAPVFFNAAWIGAVLLFSHMPPSLAMDYLSLGILCAFVIQWAFTAIFVRKEIKRSLDWKTWIRPSFFSAEWRKILRPMAMGVAGIGAMQLNSTLDALFAYFAEEGGPAYLWYAIRVQQLPLAFFGMALSGALLPPLARAAQQGDSQRYQELLSHGLRRASLFMVPCVFGIFALGGCGLNLLYGRGAFTSADVWETLFCLWAYGLGLLPAVFILLVAAGSYAKKNYATPALASLFAVGIHFCLNLVLIFVLGWGAVSVAVSTSVSAWCNLWFLSKGKGIFSNLIGYIAKLSAISVLASISAIGVGYWLGDATISFGSFNRVFSSQIWQFIAMAGIYWAVFLSSAELLGEKLIFSWLR